MQVCNHVRISYTVVYTLSLNTERTGRRRPYGRANTFTCIPYTTCLPSCPHKQKASTREVKVKHTCFLVYINDLGQGVTGKILKFADDTKLFRTVKEIGDKHNLQDDIDKLIKWSEKWQMLFNFGKCKCLHTGSENTGMNYEMEELF